MMQLEEKTKSKHSRQTEIIKIRTDINEIETKKAMQKLNESQSVFEKINKIEKPLAQLTKTKKERAQFLTESEMNRETPQKTSKKLRMS